MHVLWYILFINNFAIGEIGRGLRLSCGAKALLQLMSANYQIIGNQNFGAIWLTVMQCRKISVNSTCTKPHNIWNTHLTGYKSYSVWPIYHYSDVMMGMMSSQITSVSSVYSAVYHRFRRRSKKTSKLCVIGVCVTGEFPAQMASNAEDVSIWWRHHDDKFLYSRGIFCVMFLLQASR